MAENKDKKVLNVPFLRFPEFSGEWDAAILGNVAHLSKGCGISKDKLSTEGKPCILYGELYTKYTSEIINEIFSRTNTTERNLVQSEVNDVIIPASGETAIDIATARCVRKRGVLLGGDLNIIRFENQDGSFFSYQLNGVRKRDIAKIAQGVSVVHLYGDKLRNLKVFFPSLIEQKRISQLLSLIDERIATQRKIIEDLKKLKSAIIDRRFKETKNDVKLDNLISEVSLRNKEERNIKVLSVSNRLGFIAQSEQFGDRAIASEDTSNYKIVKRNDFAYNPARINVGSIARLINFDEGIVSPMYLCFRCNEQLLPEYLEQFFESKVFKTEVDKRLEGSVRLCLSFDSLKSIALAVSPLEEQKGFAKRLILIQSKLELETQLLELYQKQRQSLLTQMFI